VTMSYAIHTPTRRMRVLTVTGLLACALFFALAVAQARAAYNGPTAVIAYEASATSYLHVFEPGGEKIGSRNITFENKLAPGTSPSIAGYDIKEAYTSFRAAFAGAGSNELWRTGCGSGACGTGQGMAAGASPSIAQKDPGTAENTYGFAMRANTGTLDCNEYVTTYGIAAGTNPSIAWVYSNESTGAGEFVAAFNAAGSHNLWIYHCGTHTATELGLGLAEGTSPSITGNGNNYYAVAFHAAGSNDLWIYSTAGTVSTGYGLAAGTSPGIAPIPGGVEVAFNAAGSNDLFVYSSPTGVGTNTGLGMSASTSPSIAERSLGYWEVAFTANTNILYGYSSVTGAHNYGYTVTAGTSPSIAP
jgi:hypothetical protein